MIESLEERRFLSVTLDEGVLTVIGTHKADNIQLTVDPRTPDQVSVNVNGDVRRFLLSDVEQINILAGQGDDFIFVDRHQVKLTQPARIYGSGGNDVIASGIGNDRIYGGDGNDVIDAGPGHDIIYGEAGKDKIDGGAGNDAIDGGSGNDVLIGSAGIDRIIGNSGNDLIDSKDGDVDSVDGGSGNDTVFADKLDGLTSIEVVNPSPNPFA
ncbi:MAG TPA: calcium-binding protein [Tepidisphaeraceae bacterium]|nr:calcium-binding protein [Tepidisphaeraceae bacterium]